VPCQESPPTRVQFRIGRRLENHRHSYSDFADIGSQWLVDSSRQILASKIQVTPENSLDGGDQPWRIGFPWEQKSVGDIVA